MIYLLRNQPSDSIEFNVSNIPETREGYRFEVEGDLYNCHAVNSRNSEWTLAYGLHSSDENSTLFRLRGESIDYSTTATRPIAGSIANDGTMAAIVHDDSNTRAVGLTVVKDDEVTVDMQLESVIADILVRPDGEVVAIATRPPDECVYTFDTLSGKQRWKYTLPRETPHVLGYHGSDNLLILGRKPREEPYVALDTRGEVAWGCDRYHSQRPFRKRVREWLSQRSPIGDSRNI
jgi:outer membrane protein assembly factor BamB